MTQDAGRAGVVRVRAGPEAGAGVAAAEQPGLWGADRRRGGAGAAADDGGVARPVGSDLRGGVLGGHPAAGRAVGPQPPADVPGTGDRAVVVESAWVVAQMAAFVGWSPGSGTSTGSPGEACWPPGSWPWRSTRPATPAWNGATSRAPGPGDPGDPGIPGS